MSAMRWHTPLDPGCPEVEHWGMIEIREDTEMNGELVPGGTWIEDPMMAYSGCADEFYEDFERKHSQTCERCREYGLANIEVI